MKKNKSMAVLWSAIWLLLSITLYAVAGVQRLGIFDSETLIIFSNDIFPYVAIMTIDFVLIPLLFVISYYAEKAKMIKYTKFLKILRVFFLIYFTMSIIIFVLLGLGVAN